METRATGAGGLAAGTSADGAQLAHGLPRVAGCSCSSLLLLGITVLLRRSRWPRLRLDAAGGVLRLAPGRDAAAPVRAAGRRSSAWNTVAARRDRWPSRRRSTAAQAVAVGLYLVAAAPGPLPGQPPAQRPAGAAQRGAARPTCGTGCSARAGSRSCPRAGTRSPRWSPRTGADYAGDFLVADLSDDRRRLEVDPRRRRAARAPRPGPAALQFAGALGGLLGALPPRRAVPGRQRLPAPPATRTSSSPPRCTCSSTSRRAPTRSPARGTRRRCATTCRRREWVIDNARGTALGVLRGPGAAPDRRPAVPRARR